MSDDLFEPEENETKLERIKRVLRQAEDKEGFDFIAMLFILDESYERKDITQAMKEVEREKGW